MHDDVDQSDLINGLEQALFRCRLEDGQLHQKIVAVLHRSVEYGRANRALGDDPDDSDCAEYVAQVINNYEDYHSLVTCLKKGDPEAWAAIIKKIRGWANGYLKRQHIHGPLRRKSVNECITNSVLAYLSGTYHYDADFDAWFCVLVQNVCRKYIKEQRRPNQISQEKALSYDKINFPVGVLTDKDVGHSQQLKDLRYMLLEAIGGLSSEARKELILLYYFSGYSFKEIATKMNKTLNAIYKLHFDALSELRDNLGQPNKSTNSSMKDNH